MFDTHIHLNDDQFSENLDKYIKEGNEAGVHSFLVVSWDLESSKKAIEIAHKYDCCYAAIGFHPCDCAKMENNEVLQEFLTLFDDPKVVCLGEIGLDYYWEKDPIKKEQQKKWFIYQLELAKKHNLPVSIHTRDSIQDAFDILKDHAQTKFIVHCFNASEEMFNRFMKLDCLFGIGGVCTFKNATNLKEVVKIIPRDRLVIETDAPYLSPVPYRGKLNEPKYIKKTYEYVAELRGETFEDLEEYTTKNAKDIFLNGK